MKRMVYDGFPKDLDRKEIVNYFKRVIRLGYNTPRRLFDAMESERGDYNYLEALLLAQDAEFTEVIIATGADIHAYNDLPIRWASHLGNADVVELLIQKGVSVRGKAGDCALKWAITEGHPGVVEILLDNGARFLPACSEIPSGLPKEEHIEILWMFFYRAVAKLRRRKALG